uniref:Uncharacterized protein n=1 Tax=viral metagenome TaxID=1070528 RepID=A0A6C0EB78_9ZZZZ
MHVKKIYDNWCLNKKRQNIVNIMDREMKTNMDCEGYIVDIKDNKILLKVYYSIYLHDDIEFMENIKDLIDDDIELRFLTNNKN